MTTTVNKKPDAATSDGPPPRPWWLVGAALAIIAIGVAAIIWWPATETDPLPGGTPTTQPTDPTTEPTTPIPTVETTAALYFMGETSQNTFRTGPHLVAVGVTAVVPEGADTQELVTTSLGMLLDETVLTDVGDSRLSTSIPAFTELLGVEIEDTTAIVDLSRTFADGGTANQRIARVAQIVYTATAVPGVEDVWFKVDGLFVEEFVSGLPFDGPQSRDDWTVMLPLIFVDTPLPGAEVQSGFELGGIANAFEATVHYRLVTTKGEGLTEGFMTALCGTGCFGEFGDLVFFDVSEPTAAILEVFEASAENGQPRNVSSVPITLLPGGEPIPVNPAPTARSFDVIVADLRAEPIQGEIVLDVPWGDVGIDEAGFGPCCFDVYDFDSVVVLDAANLRVIRFSAGEEPKVLAQWAAGDFVPDAIAVIRDRVIVLGMTNRTNRPHDAVVLSLDTGEELQRVETTVPMNVDLRATTDGVYWAVASANPTWTAIADNAGNLLSGFDQATHPFLPGEATLQVAWDAGVEVTVTPAGDSRATTYDVLDESAAFGDVLGIPRNDAGVLVLLTSEYDIDGRATMRVLELGVPPDQQLSANLFSVEIQRWAESSIFNNARYALGGLYVMITTPDGMQILRYDF